MSYKHYCIARVDTRGDTTYLNVAGSWHNNPAQATPFFEEFAVGAAVIHVRSTMKTLTGRIEIATVTTSVHVPHTLNHYTTDSEGNLHPFDPMALPR